MRLFLILPNWQLHWRVGNVLSYLLTMLSYLHWENRIALKEMPRPFVKEPFQPPRPHQVNLHFDDILLQYWPAKMWDSIYEPFLIYRIRYNSFELDSLVRHDPNRLLFSTRLLSSTGVTIWKSHLADCSNYLGLMPPASITVVRRYYLGLTIRTVSWTCLLCGTRLFENWRISVLDRVL